MATLKDVAREAGVSIATVSYVLNGTKSLTPEVTKRVQDAAKAVGYRQNRSAKALKTGRSHTLGFILPDLTNPYFPELAQSVAKTAYDLGYSLLLIDSSNQLSVEAEYFQLLAEHRVDGAIWIPVSDHYTNSVPFPVVVVDRPLKSFDAVLADHYQGGALLANHVHKLGHKHIGLLSGPQDLSSAKLRRDGFLSAAKTLNIRWEHEVPFSIDLSKPVIKTLQNNTVTAIVAANDLLAISAIRTLESAGLRVPEDVSVVGFDDIPMASLMNPALTTIHQPLSEIGKQAVLQLHKRILDASLPTEHTLLPVELIERRSTLPLSLGVNE